MANNKVALNLDKFTGLQALLRQDKKRFTETLQRAMALADYAAKKGEAVPSIQDFDYLRYIKMEYPDGIPTSKELNADIQEIEEKLGMTREEFIEQVLDAFLDYKGILSWHHHKGEAKAMEILKHDATNPLGVNHYITLRGEDVTPEEFWGGEKPNLKELLQKMFYVGRYLSHVDLVRYLMLGEFHLYTNMQNEHIRELLQIQPALKYQQEHDIVPGTLVKGTGFFDLGEEATKPRKDCPACKSLDWITSEKDFVYCLRCYGGGYKKGENQ